MYQFSKQLKNLQLSTDRQTYFYGERNGTPYKFAPSAIGGSVPAAAVPYVTAVESGNAGYYQTLLTLVACPVTMADTGQGGGIKIYTFPGGRIQRLGAMSSLAMTTTSVIATTLNSGVTCNYGVGSTTWASATVATTEQDFVNVTAWTSSTTINVAAAAAVGTGIAVLASLDGTGTAIAAFLNLGVAGATDIDADATVTVSGTIRLSWANLGSGA